MYEFMLYLPYFVVAACVALAIGWWKRNNRVVRNRWLWVAGLIAVFILVVFVLREIIWSTTIA